MTGVRRRPAEAAIRTSSRRAKVAFYVLLGFALFVLARFFIVQVRMGPKLAMQAYDQHLTATTFAARRGAIYDRDGNVLVRSLPSQSVYASTGDVVGVAHTASELARILGDRSPADLRASLGGTAGYVQIDHKVSRERADAIEKLDLAGISIVPEVTGVRFVPSGRLASTVIGFTGFNENGLDGLEYSYDAVLRGMPGRMTLEDDGRQHTIPFAQPHVVVAAQPGRSLVLTLDSYLQYEVQRVLGATVAKWHAESGSALVMDPYTGEILALANAPDYDVRHYGRYSDDERRDRAVTDAYEPGSTFKLVTVAAAIDSGRVAPDERFVATDELAVGGRTIHNADDGMMAQGRGSESVSDIIAYSHNVGAARIGLALGATRMSAALARFGFGEPTDVGLPGESPGIVPALADWSASTLPTIAFGQGIATTPIAMARAYCAIANGGLLMKPILVSDELDADGRVVAHTGPTIVRRAMSAKTAEILRGYLREVVTRGTGHGVAEIPGYAVAGKTGTAQIAANGYYQPGAYVASFIGFVPAQTPRYVILVKVVHPRGSIYGGTVAAPAFAQIAKLAMMRAGVEPVIPPAPHRPRPVAARRVAKRTR